MQTAERRSTITAIALLVLAALPSCVARLALATHRVAINYNEGWNALHADRLQQGLPLYPSADALIYNNYPPISFQLVAWLGGAHGDLVMTLRVISVVGLLVTIGTAGFTVAIAGRSRLAGGFTAALLFAIFALPYREYVGMADPQFIAHAFMGVAMLLTARYWEDDAGLRWALLFQLLGGLTKHNLVALPVATALTLLLTSRARGLKLIAVGVPLGIAGLAGVRWWYGPDAIRSILMGRPTSFARGLQKTRGFLPPIAAPLVIGLGACVTPLTRPIERLFGLYLVLALGLGLAFAGGAGTNVNIYFDAAIAASVLGGLLVARLLTAPMGRWMALVPLAFGLTLMRPARAAWSEARELLLDGGIAARTDATTADVAYLRGIDGPVACEMLSLCYWAGKGFEADYFNSAQAMLSGRAGADNVRTRIIAGRYAAVQFIVKRAHQFRLGAADSVDVLALYGEARQSPNGVFYVRRPP